MNTMKDVTFYSAKEISDNPHLLSEPPAGIYGVIISTITSREDYIALFKCDNPLARVNEIAALNKKTVNDHPMIVLITRGTIEEISHLIYCAATVFRPNGSDLGPFFPIDRSAINECERLGVVTDQMAN